MNVRATAGSPPVRGFAVCGGPDSRDLEGRDLAGVGGLVPAFLQAGTLHPLEDVTPAGGPRVRGWLVGATPDAAATALAAVRRSGVLLCGELYHRERLLDTLELTDAELTDAELTDADIVAAAWQRFGSSGLRLLNGRFAAVLFGTDDGPVLITDHAGSVPLYVSVDGAGWSVATEAKCLRARSASAVTDLAGTRAVARTVGVHQVRGASAVRLRGGRHTDVVRTWVPPQHRSTMAPDESTSRLRAVLDAAVATRLRPQCTVVLSGGVDSGAVTALGSQHQRLHTLTMGTEVSDEFAAARVVAEHAGTDHRELHLPAADVLAALPRTVAAAEIVDAEVVEYLLPLVALMSAVPAPATFLTGYGADIPLGGMHRTLRDPIALDDTIAAEIAEVDVLNEMSPVVGGFAGHWTTHPYWDREVLDLLLQLPASHKLRDGTDKWVLRAAVAGDLPAATARRAKLGVHEGSGSQSAWTAALRERGVAEPDVPAVKNAVVAAIFDEVVTGRRDPEGVDLDEVHDSVLGATRTHQESHQEVAAT